MEKEIEQLENNNINDKLDSINEKLLNLLVEKKESISLTRVAKIMHRTLTIENTHNHPKLIKKFNIKNTRWTFISLHPKEATIYTGSEISSDNATIKTIIFPGLYKNEELYNEIDNLYDKLLEKNIISEHNIYRIAAFFLIIAATAHWFTDWNGRVSVSVAKYLIDKFWKHKLSLKNLQSIDNDNLINAMVLSSLSLFPKKENIYLMKKPWFKKRHNINLKSYSSKQQENFINRFTESILKNMKEFWNWLTITNEFLKENISIVASILEKNSF